MFNGLKQARTFFDILDKIKTFEFYSEILATQKKLLGNEALIEIYFHPQTDHKSNLAFPRRLWASGREIED